jgi:serine/threonine-protein kinase
MEFIEGKDLQKALDERRSPFPVDIVIKWAIQLCELLQVLHTQEPNPIVHQDLKPANIILRQPGASSTDIVLFNFDVARFVRIGARVSAAFGTPGYAPKEQIVDGRPEPRSDLYALAVCMYQLLTKKEPSEKPPPFPVPARNANRRVPQWLSDLIAINLNWDEPQERYESAAKMREDLINRRVTATIR